MDQQPSFLEKFSLSPKQLWENHKLFLIVFGVILLVIKFQDVILRYLVNKSNTEVTEAKTKSDQLSKQEDQANNEANNLVKHSEELGENRPTVDENWNKKK